MNNVLINYIFKMCYEIQVLVDLIDYNSPQYCFFFHVDFMS